MASNYLGDAMHLISTEFRLGYPDDPTRHFQFEKHLIPNEWTLVPGIAQWSEVKKIKGKKVLLEFEEPNRWLSGDPNFNRTGPDLSEMFDHVITLCPYSHDYFRSTRSGQVMYFPINESHIPRFAQKKFDVVYAGNMVSPVLHKMVKSLSKFNSAIISGSKSRYITHRNISHFEKLELLSRSRVSVVHNQLFLDRSHVKNLKVNLPGWRSHGAFSKINNGFDFRKYHNAPQLKSRIFEATACGSLCLVIEDDWNVQNQYFEANIDYVPTSWENLEKDLKSILNNYGEYEQMISHAREKTMSNYTTGNFVDDFLVGLED